jgi:hypothetical protein
VSSIHEINEFTKESDWFAVFFDNEYVSPDLRAAMLTIIEKDVDIDCFVFMEMYPNEKVFQSPRMFKKHIKLREGGFMPTDKSSKFERILDGWIYKWVSET